MIQFHRAYRLIGGVLDILYPPRCLVCERISGKRPWLCDGCIEMLCRSTDVRCHAGLPDFQYLSAPLYFDRIYTVWPYSPEIGTLVHHVKYRSGRQVGLWLGRFVAERLHPILAEESDGILIPVPLHPLRRRERGFNQSALYARRLSERFGMPVLEKVLIRYKATPSQTLLSAEARQDNVRNAFRVRYPEQIRRRRIYIIDDLVTTGATLNACARRLKESGVKEVTGIALVRPRIRLDIRELS
ncbi:MAG TPA: ComF family protein [bacterium]|nr:ComF family protein [bacterium]